MICVVDIDVIFLFYWYNSRVILLVRFFIILCNILYYIMLMNFIMMVIGIVFVYVFVIVYFVNV